MRFSKSSLSRKRTGGSAPRARAMRLESLETRDLLSLSTTSADYRALVSASSFGDDSAIWVTSLADVSNASDGKITLREALDYAGQELKAGVVSKTIKFAVGGTITLSTQNQSLKILSKSVTIDATDVGGVTIKAQNSLAFYVFNGSTTSQVNVEMTGLTITGGSSASKGGAVQLAARCNLMLDSCSIVNNRSTTALGAGVYATSGTLQINNSYFQGNGSSSESSQGGAIYLESGELLATNSTFKDNTAGEGGAVYIKNGAPSFASCLFEGNTATSGNGGAVFSGAAAEFYNASFLSNTSAGNGGAISLGGDSESVIYESQFRLNSAVSGGAVLHAGQALSVLNAAFEENTATQSGGSVCIDANSQLYANGLTVRNSSADASGGAVFNAGAFYCETGEFIGNSTGGSGGALASTGYVEIRNALFDENKASEYGGAVAFAGSQYGWILGSVISGSSAQEGAAISNSGTLTLAGSEISENTASYNGGGISNQGTLFVAQSTLAKNVAQGSAGGGILNYVNSQLTVENSVLDQNETSGAGGGIANGGAAMLTNVSIVKNTAAQFGGGVYNEGDLTAQFVVVSNNSAENGGGVATTYGSSAGFNYATLRNNAATSKGGALYSYGAPVFSNSSLQYNVAETASVAAYYSAEAAAAAPVFDSASTINSNYASSSVSNLVENADVEVLAGSALKGWEQVSFVNLGSFAVNDTVVRTESFALRNSGDSTLRFSNFSETSNFDSNVFSWSLTREDGTAIAVSGSFDVAPGEIIMLTTTVDPKKLGSRAAMLAWQTDELSNSGTTVRGTTKSVSVLCAAEISRAAAATVNVSKLDDSDFNISVNQTGSFTFQLSQAPESSVVVRLSASSDAVLLSSDVLLFTKSNYSEAQTVTVKIDAEKLRDADLLTEIVITPQILTADPNFSGKRLADVAIEVEGYVVFDGDSSIDINELVPSGTTRWDFNGDGVVDAITYGSPYWIDESRIDGDSFAWMRTRNGVTTTETIDAVRLESAPIAVAEITSFATQPGAVRVSLSSETSPAQRWRLDWGDGTPYAELAELSDSALFAHAYTADGDYEIRVEAIDAEGRGAGVWKSLGIHTVSGLSSTALLDVALEESIFDNSHDCDFAEEPIDLVAQALVAQEENFKRSKR